MKTPWSGLLEYGLGIAVMVVICVAGILLLATVGIAVAVTKFADFIK